MMLNVGVIGYGYWGPNLVRNFNSLKGVRVLKVADLKPDRTEKVKVQYPHIATTNNPDDVINDPMIDAVLIATPINTHYELTRKALLNNKHVLVEKPLAGSSDEAEELVNLAESKNLVMLVDHTFIYTGAVRKVKEIINTGTLGEVLYFDSIRVNLGLFQPDMSVIWDLAPHDLSILEYLIGSDPEGVVATGTSHFNPDVENIAYITLYYADGLIAHINVSWLSPVKIRLIMIGGTKKMIVYDDTEPSEKVKVYDKSVEIQPANNESVYKYLVEYRTGDMWAPKLENKEALRTEAEHFVDCVVNGIKPITDGHFGLKIVRLLEKIEESLKRKGNLVFLG